MCIKEKWHHLHHFSLVTLEANSTESSSILTVLLVQDLSSIHFSLFPGTGCPGSLFYQDISPQSHRKVVVTQYISVSVQILLFF